MIAGDTAHARKIVMTTGLPIDPRRAQQNGTAKPGPGRAGPCKKLLKHGLTVRRVIAFDESVEAFEQFYLELAAALGPKDAVEEVLVERIIICAWRLRRLYRIESGLFSKARTSWKDGVATITHDIELVFLRLASNDDDLAKLGRYETGLERSLVRTLRELHRYQRRPRGAVF